MSSSESEQNLHGCCDPDLKVGHGHQNWSKSMNLKYSYHKEKCLPLKHLQEESSTDVCMWAFCAQELHQKPAWRTPQSQKMYFGYDLVSASDTYTKSKLGRNLVFTAQSAMTGPKVRTIRSKMYYKIIHTTSVWHFWHTYNFNLFTAMSVDNDHWKCKIWNQ